jgi:hypothetical protein
MTSYSTSRNSPRFTAKDAGEFYATSPLANRCVRAGLDWRLFWDANPVLQDGFSSGSWRIMSRSSWAIDQPRAAAAARSLASSSGARRTWRVAVLAIVLVCPYNVVT